MDKQSIVWGRGGVLDVEFEHGHGVVKETVPEAPVVRYRAVCPANLYGFIL